METKRYANKLYIDRFNNLWSAYQGGCGTVIPQIRSHKGFSNVDGVMKYDSFLPYFFERVDQSIAHTTRSEEYDDIILYKVPAYKGNEAHQFDIWGGEEKPASYLWISVTTSKVKNRTIVHVFQTLEEAKGYHQF